MSEYSDNVTHCDPVMHATATDASSGLLTMLCKLNQVSVGEQWLRLLYNLKISLDLRQGRIGDMMNVYNHTSSSRPDVRYRAPDPDVFTSLIADLKLCSTSNCNEDRDLHKEMTRPHAVIEPRRKKHYYYPSYFEHRQRNETHLSYG